MARRTRFLATVEGRYPKDGPEGLLIHHQQGGVGVGDHSGREEPAAVIDAASEPFAADRDAGALGSRVGNLPLAVAIDLFVDQRSERTSRGQAVADIELGDMSKQRVQKCGIDRALDVNAIDAVAELAGIGEGVAGDRGGGDIDVGVGADDRGTMPPQLKRHAFQGPRSRRRDRFSGFGSASESDLSRNRMLDHMHADVGPAPGHDIETAWRKAHLVKNLREYQRRERRVLGGLGDDRAARDERRTEFEA